MKKILFLTNQLPYPAISGGFIKSYKLIKELHQHYELTVATLLKGDNSIYLEEFKQQVQIQSIVAVPCDVSRSVPNIIKANLQGKSISFYRNYSRKFQQEIDAIVEQFDVVIADHLEVFQYVAKKCYHKTILHQHNAEFLMWQRAASVATNPLQKLILYLQSYLIKRKEIEYCNLAKVVLAAPNDEAILEDNGANKANFKLTYHLGEDDLLHQPSLTFETTQKELLYIGTLTWEANVHGLLWFIENCWQQLSTNYPDLVFTIIGKNPDERLVKAVAHFPAIHLLGFIEDTEPYFKRARVFVVPLLFGSGIKVKVISALYRGIPCVTTSVGVEGLEVKNGTHILYSDTAKEFIQQIELALNDAQVWNTIAKESRIIAQQKYSWQTVFNILHGSIDIL